MSGNSDIIEPCVGFDTQVAVPTAFSVDIPFEAIHHLLSDKPLRRFTPKLTPDQVRKVRDTARQSPPPQTWFDEDLSELQ